MPPSGPHPEHSAHLRPEPTSEPVEDPDLLRDQARGLVDEKRFGDALPLLQRLVDHDPRDADAWELIARSFYALGAEELTARAANAAITADPYAAGGYLWKTRHQLRWGSDALAINAGREGVEMTHGDPDVRIALAEALLRRNATTDAAETIHPLLFTMPEYPPLMALQGEVYRRQAQEPAAIAWFTGATDRDPQCAAAWAGLGELHRNHQRWEEAGDAYHRAAVSAPEQKRYREAFVEVLDEVVGSARPGCVLTSLFTVSLVLTLWYSGGRPWLILAGLLFTAVAWNVVRFAIAGWVLGNRVPHLVSYYRFAKPREVRTLLGGCGILVGGLVLLGGLGFVTANGLWAEGLRTVALVALVGGWTWWGITRLLGRKRVRLDFRFPSEAAIAGIRLAADEPGPVVRGWRQITNGNPAAAGEAAREVLARDGDQPGALHLAAMAALCQKDPAAARSAAGYARTLDPEDTRPCALYWMALAVEGRPGAAEAEAAMAPRMVDAVVADMATYASGLGFCYATAEMEAVVDLLRRLSPDAAETHIARGDLAMMRAELAGAEASYRAALSTDPTHVSAMVLLGITLRARGKWRDAGLMWSRALQSDPGDARAREYLESDVSGAMTRLAILAIVALGIIGLIPTALKSPRNNWMPLVVFLGPWVTAALAQPAHRLVTLLIAPGLGKENAPGFRRSALSVVPLAFLGLFVLQMVQVWWELALHPEYFPVRWPGAAVITLLVLSGVAIAILVIRAPD